MRHFFRSDIDLTGEHVRDAFPELGRLLTRRPARSAPWRDFWKVFVPSITPLLILTALWDPADWSLVEWIAIIVASYLVAAMTGWLFQHIGLIRKHPA